MKSVVLFSAAVVNYPRPDPRQLGGGLNERAGALDGRWAFSSQLQELLLGGIMLTTSLA